MPSIQSKLSTGLILSLIIAFTALWILVSINVQFLAKEYIASRLKHDAENLLNIVHFNDAGALKIDQGHIDLIYSQPFSGHYYVISTDSQTIRSRSLWDQELKAGSAGTGQYKRTELQGPEQQDLLLISGGYQKQGYLLTISIAEDLNPINRNISLFSYWFTAMALTMLITLVILQIVILRKSLEPLTRIRTELKLLQQGQLQKLNTRTPAELRPMIDEINHLLDMMDQRLRRSRDALSDLAHAIKKPLTVIKQLTGNNTIPDSTRSLLIKQTDDIYSISDNILKRARLAGTSHTGARFSFTEDLPALLKTLHVMYAGKNISLTTKIETDISVPVDREDMLELLGNLLDNAFKWAAGRIILSVTNKTSLCLCIEDDGTGVDPEQINELIKRGVRLDEKIHGHGFGLAISADIVHDYNGDISFSQSNVLGGLKAEITLPLQSDTTQAEGY